MTLSPGTVQTFWFRLRELCWAAGDRNLGEVQVVCALATERLFGLGVDQYGDAWMTRDNALEALDEWADGINYAIMDALRVELLDIPADDARAVRAELLAAARHGVLAHGHSRKARELLARTLNGD